MARASNSAGLGKAVRGKVGRELAFPEILLPYQKEWLLDRGSIKVWLASRQAGKSFTVALEAVLGGLELKRDKIILSASERQSREVMEQVWRHLRACEAVSRKRLLKSGGKEEINLVNGSRIIALPANPDTIRGFTGDILLDEFAFHQDAEEIWRAIYPAVTRGYRVSVVSTPNGRNLFYDLWQRGDVSKHKTDIYEAQRQGLKVDIESIKKNLSDDAFDREYMCSFTATAIGSYYGKLIREAEAEGRVGNVPYDPSLPVHTYWDLGIGDSTAIWFVQSVGKEVRLIDYYEAQGEGLPHYVAVLQKKGYVYGGHNVPFDAKVRELGSGKSRLEVALSLGLRMKVVPRLSIEDGIEAVRNLLPRCWFDRARCSAGLDALRNYRKEWNADREEFSAKPVKDWSSHSSDAFRYLAVGEKGLQEAGKPITVSQIMAKYRSAYGGTVWA